MQQEHLLAAVKRQARIQCAKPYNFDGNVYRARITLFIDGVATEFCGERWIPDTTLHSVDPETVDVLEAEAIQDARCFLYGQIAGKLSDGHQIELHTETGDTLAAAGSEDMNDQFGSYRPLQQQLAANKSTRPISTQSITFDEAKQLIDGLRHELLARLRWATLMSPTWVANTEGPLDELNVEPGTVVRASREIQPRAAAEAFVESLCQSEGYEESTLYRLINFIYGKSE